MPSFKSYYQSIFKNFGAPLTKAMEIESSRIDAAQKRLGVRIPKALREYYLVAGKERRFNMCHNRILAPEKWEVDRGRLIFMEENQWFFWSISLRTTDADDPPVAHGMDDEPITWVRWHRHCSVFLAVMLHYQAIAGGMRTLARAHEIDQVRKRLRKGWTLLRPRQRPEGV